MAYHDAVTALVKALVTLYPREESIRAIVIQTGVPEGEVSFSSRAVDTWTSVLSKARQYNKAEAIIGTALEAYPAYAELQVAVAAYREVVARGDVPPLPLRRCDFYAHVTLSPHFVARPALLHDVRETLLATPTMALTSAIPMDALHGMGGIGKSVVARALCDDAEVQDAFSDGILWATIGQTPDLIARLREWIEELGGIIPQTAPTINQLKQNLAELLTDRACLLILDDVWHRTDAEPFLVGGPRCRLLLTTRDSEVARGLGAGVHAVPAMDPDEAVDLLELWAGGAIHQTDEALMRQIVRRLGYLPLAIKLAGSQLQRKSPERWLAGFDATQLQERRVEKVHDSLARTFALSLDELEATERRLYAALAIFREDEAIPIPGIGKLWAGLAGYSEDQTVDLVQDLAARALLQIADGAADGSPAAVIIHDLLRDFMAAKLGDAGRPAAHRAIVEAYRRTQTGNDWATARDDGYLYDHLVYHLEQLADHEPSAVAELQSLFADDAWLQVRVSGADYQYDSYLADLEVVWQRAHQETLWQIEAGREPAAFAGCVRYALIRTSVNSLSGNYLPALVTGAVDTGLWSIQQAFSIVHTIPDPESRTRMLTALLAMDSISTEVRGSLTQVALTTVQFIEDQISHVEALVALVPHLSGDEKTQTLTQELEFVETIENERSRAQALTALAPHLSGELLTQGLAIARAIEDEISHALAMAALVQYQSREEMVQALMQGLAAAQTIENERARVQALAAIVPYLSTKEKIRPLVQALTTVQAIEDEWDRAEALADLAPQLEGEYLAQGLTIAQAFENEWNCAEALAALAPQMKGEYLAQGLAAAQAIEDAGSRVEALVALVPHLSGEEKAQVLAQGLATAQAIEDAGSRVEALVALVPHLSGEEKAQVVAQALVFARVIDDEWASGEALAAMVPNLLQEHKTRVLAEGLVAAKIIKNEWSRAVVLATLAPQLEGEYLAQGLAVAQTIEDEGSRVKALVALVPHLPKDLLEEGLTVAQAFENEWNRAEMLAALAPQLSGNLLAQGLTTAQAFKNEYPHVKALVALVPHLSGEEKAQALAQGLAAAWAIRREDSRVEALVALAPHLSGEEKAHVLRQGLVSAQVIENERARVEALVALAPHLSGEDKAQALVQGLAAARAIRREDSRVKALAALAPHLSGEERAQALAQGLATAQAIEYEGFRVEALATLTPHLPGEERAQALAQGLAAAQAIKDEESRFKALVCLLPTNQNTETFLREIRLTTALHLWRNIRYQERADLLSLFHWAKVFCPPIFDTNTLSRITTHIIEICRHWTWP